MDANQACECILGFVKNSNLNYNLNESPFSVNISIRKSFIKDKDGAVRVPNLGGFHSTEPKASEFKIEDKVESLQATIAQHESENEVLNLTIHDLSIKLEKAKAELSDTISENKRMVDAKNLSEKEISKKQKEYSRDCEWPRRP